LVNPNNPNVLWAHMRPSVKGAWPAGRIYRGGRSGTWERLSLGPFDAGDGSTFLPDACSAAGLTYDPNLNALYTGCDITYYFGGNRDYRLLRSANADSPDSSKVAWEQQTNWGSVPDDYAGVNTVRPLAVDAREPKSLFVVIDVTRAVGQPRYRLMVSHDDGTTWVDLVPGGLPGNQN
jgi:hypothetical protein